MYGMRIVFFILFTFNVWATPDVPSFVQAAQQQVGVTKLYNPAYKKLAYPNGDVAPIEGVCTDVIVRGLRKLGIDLQKLIHEDIKKNFNLYPHKWGLAQPDSNIDHRRVPNIVTYFQRKGLEISLKDPYVPGDIVVWELGKTAWGFGRSILHIGIVSNQYIQAKKRYKVVHNVCCGVQEEDFLHDYEHLHHFRLTPAWLQNPA